MNTNTYAFGKTNRFFVLAKKILFSIFFLCLCRDPIEPLPVIRELTVYELNLLYLTFFIQSTYYLIVWVAAILVFRIFSAGNLTKASADEEPSCILKIDCSFIIAFFLCYFNLIFDKDFELQFVVIV